MIRRRRLVLGAIGLAIFVAVGVLVARQLGGQDSIDVNLTAAEAVEAAARAAGPAQTVEGVGLLPEVEDLREVWPNLAKSPYLRSEVDGPIWVVFASEQNGDSRAPARAVFIIDDESGETVLVSQEIPSRRLEGQVAASADDG